MSIETLMKKLTEALEANTNALNALAEKFAETPSAETPSAETPSAETPSAETPSAETPSAETPSAETPSAETTFNSSKEFCDAIKALVRKNPSIKGQVKGTLGERGYGVLADVPPADYNDVYSQVKAL